MNFTDSCRNVVERMVAAYNLKTVKALSEKLNVGVSVISNRITRNTFPADLVIQCALETGADLLWLCTGEGSPNIEVVNKEKKSIELSTVDLEKLERIAALKNSGAITDDEYTLLKNSIFKNK